MGNRRGLRRCIYDWLVKKGFLKEQPCKIKPFGIKSTVDVEEKPKFEQWCHEYNFGIANRFKDANDISSLEEK